MPKHSPIPIFRKEVCPEFVRYYLGIKDGNLGFAGGLMVTVTELEQGRFIRAEVARMLLALRKDIRLRLQAGA